MLLLLALFLGLVVVWPVLTEHQHLDFLFWIPGHPPLVAALRVVQVDGALPPLGERRRLFTAVVIDDPSDEQSRR